MRIASVNDFDDWRKQSRRFVHAGVAPADIKFAEASEQTSLFDDDPLDAVTDRPAPVFAVSKSFLSLAEDVGYHRDPTRWGLLYSLLWRLTHGEPSLLEISTDDEVHRATRMQQQVRRDAHKAKAFIRFRKVVVDEVEYFIAWHDPDHRIVRKVAPFFSRRFKTMNWTILTPDESASWNQETLRYHDGVPRSSAPKHDELEDLWRTYYGSIFNPARVKIKMMKSEMPVRYWKTLPEAEIIDQLIESAPQRVEKMVKQQEGYAESAAAFMSSVEAPERSIGRLRELAVNCTACDLYQNTTQTVFGIGNESANVVIVGEQPGDREDLEGRPFVGPAGTVLMTALDNAGIDASKIYFTNVVKHFKHTLTESPQGKKRLHQRPGAREVRCCRPWLDAELQWINPKLVVCLGVTAAKAIINPGFKLTADRGKTFQLNSVRHAVATWHPAAILRMPDQERQREMQQQFVDDLRIASGVL